MLSRFRSRFGFLLTGEGGGGIPKSSLWLRGPNKSRRLCAQSSVDLERENLAF